MTLLGIVLILLAMSAGLYVVASQVVPGARNWVLGGLTAILGLCGLFVAARSGVFRPVGYYGGLVFFVVSVLTVFYLIKRTFDEAEKHKYGPTEAPALERRSSRPDIEARSNRNAVALAALALVLVGVGTVAFHFLSPWWWTPIASNWGYVDDTIIITFWITGVVFIAIIFFMAYCVFRYRHQEGRRAAYEPENKKMEWWLTGLTTVGVAGMLTPGLFVWDQFVTVPKEATEIEVLGRQWQFSLPLPRQGRRIRYFRCPESQFGKSVWSQSGRSPRARRHSDRRLDLHLPLDRPVKVLLRSIDVLHDFYVPEFRAKMDMVPGTVTYYWFTPTQDRNIRCPLLRVVRRWALCDACQGRGGGGERLSGVAGKAVDVRAGAGASGKRHRRENKSGLERRGGGLSGSRALNRETRTRKASGNESERV